MSDDVVPLHSKLFAHIKGNEVKQRRHEGEE